MTKSRTSAEFSVLVLIIFLLKIDILRLAMLIYLDGDEDQFKYCSWSVLFFLACGVIILSWTVTTLASHWILLCYFGNQKKFVYHFSRIENITFLEDMVFKKTKFK